MIKCPKVFVDRVFKVHINDNYMEKDLIISNQLGAE
jgi:hypothetical protein